MKAEIFGVGCLKCQKLEENLRAALAELHIDCEIEKVTDINEISKRGVVMTPGLAINGQLVSTGRVLTVKELIPILSNFVSKEG